MTLAQDALAREPDVVRDGSGHLAGLGLVFLGLVMAVPFLFLPEFWTARGLLFLAAIEAVCAGLIALGARFMRLGAYLSDSGLRIVNFLSTREVAWHEIKGFELGGDPSGIGNNAVACALNDGTKLSILATAVPDDRAREHLAHLNAHLANARNRIPAH